MKVIAPIIFASLFAFAAAAQEEPVQPADVVQSVREFLQDNIDADALDAAGIDLNRVQQFLAELNDRLNSTNVYELESLQQTATNLLPVLEKFEETQPYAAWLESQLEYLNALDSLRSETGMTNKVRGARPPNPSPEVERKVWIQALEKRQVPALAQKYVPIVKPIFQKEQVPPELVWLAEVESSFNPSARSPVGAAGLFQLMPVTAKGLKLSLFPRDERLQPEKNARAAASYLYRLNRRFGDWRLALAAYNAGEGRVSGLLKKRKAKTFDAIATDLPAETQMYVPRVEATVHKREGSFLAELELPKK